jgi:hypothetical protein
VRTTKAERRERFIATGEREGEGREQSILTRQRNRRHVKVLTH